MSHCVALTDIAAAITYQRKPIKTSSVIEARQNVFSVSRDRRYKRVRHREKRNWQAVYQGVAMNVQAISPDYVYANAYVSAHALAPAKDRYVMEEITFRKSVAGHNEFEHRHVLKRPELRRLLILIDGKRSIDSIVCYFRSFEFSSLLGELLELGMIEPVSSTQSVTHATVEQALGERSALKPMQFEAARRAAMHAASELLGTVARPYCASLTACQNSRDLRMVLSAVQEKLAECVGEDAATLFIESVRDAVKMSH
jgi:hypothetical protein